MNYLIHILSLAVMLVTSMQVQAGLVTFTHTGIGSGSIGGSAFASSAFTITATADTNARETVVFIYSIDHISASINIVGKGTFTFTTGTRTFFNSRTDIVGFGFAGSGGLDLYDGPSSASLHGWDMLNSIGPVTGNTTLTQWNVSSVNTSGGQLIFNSANTTGTFLAAVPESNSLNLVGIGALGMCLVAGSRRIRLTATQSN